MYLNQNGKAIEKTQVWFISKYMRLPEDLLDFEDGFQVKGGNPSRGFALMNQLQSKEFHINIFSAKHDYNFWQRSKPSRYISNRGMQLIFLPVIRFYKSKSLRRILGWIQFELQLIWLSKRNIAKPDIIIVSSLSLLSIIYGLYLARLRYKVPIIFEVRDIWPLVLTANANFSTKNPFVILLQMIERLGYKFSDGIVSTLPNLEPHVQNILGKSRSVTCIPMGLHKNLEVPNNSHNTEWKAADAFTVTYAGSIGVDNALNVILESAELLKDTNIQFHFFGNGDLKENYKVKYGNLRNIYFHDPVPIFELKSILSNSEVLILSTHATPMLEYGQSLNKLIDYMAAARPIIAAHTGFKTMINEADCGSFVEGNNPQALADKILEYSKLSIRELDEIGQRGAFWLRQNRTYEKLAGDYANLIKSMLGR